MSAQLQPSSLHGNLLLSTLPPEVQSRGFNALELVLLERGQRGLSGHGSGGYVFFPTSAIVSLTYAMGDGSSAEIAVIGNEGLLGVASFMGGEWLLGRAVVHTEGYALRAPADWVRAEFARSTYVQNLLLRYSHTLSAQTAQLALCNRHHNIEQQLCRWLLQMLDRSNGVPECKVTQELIADMLGVRRESVSDGIRRLQLGGLVSHGRGRLVIRNRLGLERRSCGCYAAMNKESERLLPRLAAFRQRLHAIPLRTGHEPDMSPAHDDADQVILTNFATDGMPALSMTNNM